jgi:transposase-like protein
LSVISRKPFHDEAAAFEYLESTLWPTGAVCPHCGTIGRATKLQGNATRMGVWKCNEKECRKQFTVKVGTVFEHGRIPLHKMLQATYLLCCSKKGCSAHQLHRILQITYKSAWFLAHRIREAMRDGSLTPMGGFGKFVEVDETFIGTVEGEGGKKAHRSRIRRRQGGAAHKNVVLTLVERGGSARSFHIGSTSIGQIVPLVRANVAKESRLMSDEAHVYEAVGREFTSHDAVQHTKEEYVRDGYIHTNTVEGYYSIFKRGMTGVYQHCKEKHLHRYLAEFDFRYSNRVRLGVDDTMRTSRALRGMVGKRLTYRAADRTGTTKAPF